MTSTLRQLIEVAAFSDSAVLVLGESGTGKELLLWETAPET